MAGGSIAAVLLPDLETLKGGPAGLFLRGAVAEVASDTLPDGGEQFDTVVSIYRLQDISDYRSAIAGWFSRLVVGGHLVLVVPHMFLCERRLVLPSPWSPDQRRLYTVRTLLEEIEEALPPNSYRVRLAADCDEGYDYAAPPLAPPLGRHDAMVVIERIAMPPWGLEVELGPSREPDIAFEPSRTRIEHLARAQAGRILLLKLDHLGDFVMSVDALRRVRAIFPAAEITLVVGSWNAEMAHRLGIADIIVPFDAFPRNASEERSDVQTKGGLLAQALPKEYDLALDLRVDRDTRPLLRNVRATIRAGLGDRTAFPFLDIFLPGDESRQEPETARAIAIGHDVFSARAGAVRTPFRIGWRSEDARRAKGALIWGPYRTLARGRYIFEPFLEIADGGRGGLVGDIALDTNSIVKVAMPSPEATHIAFAVEAPSSVFEFRVWKSGRRSVPSFSFYGGRLFRAGAHNVLHQSEYLGLLVELVRMRMTHHGMLRER
jgi:hypothetical protein